MTIILGPLLIHSLLSIDIPRFRLPLRISLNSAFGKRLTYSYDLTIPSVSRLRPPFQLSHMRNGNDWQEDDKEYTGDSTSYYQACFTSFGSPILSILGHWGVGHTWFARMIWWIPPSWWGRWDYWELSELFIISVREILSDLPMWLVARTEEMNVNTNIDIAMNINRDLVAVVQCDAIT